MKHKENLFGSGLPTPRARSVNRPIIQSVKQFNLPVNKPVITHTRMSAKILAN